MYRQLIAQTLFNLVHYVADLVQFWPDFTSLLNSYYNHSGNRYIDKYPVPEYLSKSLSDMSSRGVTFGHKVDQIDPKWDNYGILRSHFSIFLLMYA